MSSPSVRDEFFIGWLAMPPGYARFLKPAAFAVMVIVSLTAAAIAILQRDPGTGQWDDGHVVTLRGVAMTAPYAMLRVPGETTRTYLLVEDGKFGALERTSRFVNGRSEGVPVEVRGTILHRGDRWMIALEAGDSGMRSLTADEARSLPPLLPNDARTIAEMTTLRGEIVDPKCYLGAMKPGGGKTHKACAMRCIAGGIPPMLVTREAGGGETFYLLVTESGGVANEELFSFVGDRVEATGRRERRDDFLVLRTSPAAIRRP
jgi:hypothetical protein